MSLLLLSTQRNKGLFLPEDGLLYVDGKRFRTETGALWQMRGISWFLGFYRFCLGQDVTSDLRWMRANGFNTARLFGPLPWKETPDYRIENFRYDLLPQFFDLMERYGIRVNWSLAHYEHPGLQEYVQRWYDIAANFWCPMAEGVNEPHVGKTKPDPMLVLNGVDTYGVTTAYGYYFEELDGKPGHSPVSDWGTIHVPRDSAWHRRARMVQETMEATGKPWVSDEPAKIVEPDFDYPGGKNDPVRTPREMCWHAAVCYLWTTGVTYHTEEGKWGRVPRPGMLQHTVAETLRDNVFKKIDAEWQVGEYNRGGNGDSPVNNVYTEENQIWTYTSLHPDTALSVRCGTIPLKAQNGWRIVDSWLDGTIARLER